MPILKARAVVIGVEDEHVKMLLGGRFGALGRSARLERRRIRGLRVLQMDLDLI